MNKKSLFLFFAFFLFISFAYAQPPFTTQISSAGTLEIVYPKNPAFKQNNVIDLHFHVSNSTGHVLFANQSTCIIHIYDSDNKHVYIGPLTDDGVYDKSVILGSNLTDVVGYHPYMVQCNSTITNQEGYLSNFYIITTDGQIDMREFNGQFMISIAILLVGAIIAISFIISKIEYRDEGGDMIPVNSLIVLILWVSLGFILFNLFQIIAGITIGQNFNPMPAAGLKAIFQFINPVAIIIMVIIILGLIVSAFMMIYEWIRKVIK